MVDLLQIVKERQNGWGRCSLDVPKLVICWSRLSKRSSPFSDFYTLKLYLGAKIVQGERKAKCKAFGFAIFFAEPQPILSKDSARRAQDKRKSHSILLFHAEPQPHLCKRQRMTWHETCMPSDGTTRKVHHFWSRVGISKAICANFVKGYNFSAPPFPFSAETQLLLHQKREGNANTKADNI